MLYSKISARLVSVDFRQLERELNEKLAECHEKLLQAGVDRKESERDARLKETLSNLQRIFPGTSNIATKRMHSRKRTRCSRTSG